MNQSNLLKLKGICEAFQIPVVVVAKAARVSRPTASRIIHGSMIASSSFWRNLEQNLSQMIQLRTGQVFDLPAVGTDKLEQLLKVG